MYKIIEIKDVPIMQDGEIVNVSYATIGHFNSEGKQTGQHKIEAVEVEGLEVGAGLRLAPVSE